MTTSVDKLEEKALEQAYILDYVSRLLKALGDNPGDWEYTGEVTEDTSKEAQCACGHSGLRWLFWLKNKRDGRRIYVGSSCIKNFQYISIQLYNSLQDAYNGLLEKLKQAEKAAREAKQAEEVERLRAEWQKRISTAYELYNSYARNRQRAPVELWKAVASRYYSLPTCPPDYMRKSSYIRWYREQISAWDAVLLAGGSE